MNKDKLLYESIKDRIIEQISSGTLAVDEKIPTISELQKIYQVSHITILRVLKELRQMGMIEHCGRRYRVCRQFAAVSNPEEMVPELPVGLFLRPMRAFSNDNYFNEINLAIESELCLAHKYYLRSFATGIFNYKVTFSTENGQELLRDLLLLDGRCCGLLIDERLPDAVLAEFLRQRHRPAVLVNRTTALPISSVAISAEESVQLLWSKAHKLGYTDILMFAMLDSIYFNDRNFARAAVRLAEAGEIPEVKLHFVPTAGMGEAGKNFKLLQKIRELSGSGKVLLLCRNNSRGHELIRFLARENLHPGQDFGVCGFYMSSEQDGHPNQLASVRINTDFIGRNAVRLLLNNCAHPWEEQFQQLNCPQEFILGDTM